MFTIEASNGAETLLREAVGMPGAARSHGIAWIPACAGMTKEKAGMTKEKAGMTKEEAGMRERARGDGRARGAGWVRRDGRARAVRRAGSNGVGGSVNAP